MSVGRSVGKLVGNAAFWAAAPKGPMTYAFTHEEISHSRTGWDLGLRFGLRFRP